MTKLYSAISLIPLCLSPMNRSPRAARKKMRGTRATPPPNWGVMWHRVAVLSDIPLPGPMGVALVLIYLCGKAPNSPPRSGAEGSGCGCPLFPLPWMIPDRSSPSRVRFAASRPGLLRADPREIAVYEGKGGFGPGLPGRKEPFGHISVLTRSGGAESPVGP